jgi:hypothetical protein
MFAQLKALDLTDFDSDDAGASGVTVCFTLGFLAQEIVLSKHLVLRRDHQR